MPRRKGYKVRVQFNAKKPITPGIPRVLYCLGHFIPNGVHASAERGRHCWGISLGTSLVYYECSTVCLGHLRVSVPKGRLVAGSASASWPSCLSSSYHLRISLWNSHTLVLSIPNFHLLVCITLSFSPLRHSTVTQTLCTVLDLSTDPHTFCFLRHYFPMCRYPNLQHHRNWLVCRVLSQTNHANFSARDF